MMTGRSAPISRLARLSSTASDGRERVSTRVEEPELDAGLGIEDVARQRDEHRPGRRRHRHLGGAAHDAGQVLEPRHLHRPLDERLGDRHQRRVEQRLGQPVALLLLAGGQDHRRARELGIEQRAHGVAEAGRHVHVAGDELAAGARVAVSHGHHDRLLQAQHIGQVRVLLERVHDRQLGGAGIAEQVRDALVLQESEEGGAAGDAVHELGPGMVSDAGAPSLPANHPVRVGACAMLCRKHASERGAAPQVGELVAHRQLRTRKMWRGGAQSLLRSIRLASLAAAVGHRGSLMTMQSSGNAAPANDGATAASSGAGSVTLVTATALAVADMVGIGVFTSLGFQVKDLPSGFSLVLLWTVGGVMALCGALSYAELAAAFPRSGGEYNFLSRIYHQAVGFLAGWVSATVGFAAPVALAAMAFGQYLTGVVPGAPPLLMAVLVVWLVTAVQLAGIQQAATFQNVTTLLKVALILLFIVAGFALGERQPVSFVPSAADFGYVLSAPFFISLFYVMYSYAGWNAATYIAGEIRDPRRDLPLSMLIAVATVTLLYVALNAVFLYTTPIAKLAGQVDVGLVAGKQIFGDAGGRMVGALICIGLVSAVSAMMWIGPRVTMAMGEDLRCWRCSRARPEAACRLSPSCCRLPLQRSCCGPKRSIRW
jgi:APA family basic amino acid/polyamine antiporter